MPVTTTKLNEKKVKEATVSIYGGELGTMVVVYDLVEVEVPNVIPPHERHFFEEMDTVTRRSISKIHSVELRLFDSVPMNLSAKVGFTDGASDALKAKILETVAMDGLHQLGGTVEETAEKIVESVNRLQELTTIGRA